MGQAIDFSPLNPLRLGVLSEAGVRTELIGMGQNYGAGY